MLPPNLCCDQSTVPQQCSGTHKVMRDMRVFYRVYVCVCVLHTAQTLCSNVCQPSRVLLALIMEPCTHTKAGAAARPRISTHTIIISIFFGVFTCS